MSGIVLPSISVKEDLTTKHVYHSITIVITRPLHHIRGLQRPLFRSGLRHHLSRLVSWSVPECYHLFMSGLDDELLALNMLPDVDEYSLEDFINRVLQTGGCEFCIIVSAHPLFWIPPQTRDQQATTPQHGTIDLSYHRWRA